MKLASLKTGGRDGTLIVVSRDLKHYVHAGQIAKTLQDALDNWESVAPRLQMVSDNLNSDEVAQKHPFDASQCAAPLPRAYHWVDGSAYVNHVELVRKARGAEMPPSFWEDPLVYQGGSDDLCGPYDPIVVPDESFGIDLEGEIAVITDDVSMATKESDAHDHIKLVMLVNDVSLRNLIPGELAKGFGFYQSKPATAFAPVAVTPDELGEDWKEAKLHLPLRSAINGEAFGCPDAGVDMTFSFARLIEHVTKTRNLEAGTIIGSGTVSNKLNDGPGKPISEGGVGYSCIAEIRMIETIENGKPSTEFLKFGDKVRLEVLDKQGQSVFGVIEQEVTALQQPE